MAILCGVDIVYVPKIKRLIGKEATLQKFFHATELGSIGSKSGSDAQHLAGIIAAKEAFFKALGLVPKFNAVKVDYETSGRPKLIVSPEFRTYKDCDVSISHDKDYAIAFVVMEK